MFTILPNPRSWSGRNLSFSTDHFDVIKIGNNKYIIKISDSFLNDERIVCVTGTNPPAQADCLNLLIELYGHEKVLAEFQRISYRKGVEDGKQQVKNKFKELFSL